MAGVGVRGEAGEWVRPRYRGRVGKEGGGSV